MKARVYVCHTFYHAYIAVIKELNLPETERGKATLILSTMSNDFGDMADRTKRTGLFEDVLMYDEKPDTFFPEVMKYHADKGNIILNLLQRMRYTKMLGKMQEKYVPVDFTQFREINVFCDSDPIGYYLNYKKIKYHAQEDGLDTIKQCDDARYSNLGHWKLKSFLARHNLIFIPNGYSKYCVDMEVNDISCLKYEMSKYKEVPREKLINGVAKKDCHYLMDIFMPDGEKLLAQLREGDSSRGKLMILSDPVCELDVRKQIMLDIIAEYGKGMQVIIKPHPRDVLSYETEDFKDCVVIRGKFPMEIMNYFPELHVDTVVSIFTVVDAIRFADQKILLGTDFMDKYEDPALHRQNDVI